MGGLSRVKNVKIGFDLFRLFYRRVFVQHEDKSVSGWMGGADVGGGWGGFCRASNKEGEEDRFFVSTVLRAPNCDGREYSKVGESSF